MLKEKGTGNPLSLNIPKKIDSLNDQIAELGKGVDIDEWHGSSRIKDFWKRY